MHETEHCSLEKNSTPYSAPPGDKDPNIHRSSTYRVTFLSLTRRVKVNVNPFEKRRKEKQSIWLST